MTIFGFTILSQSRLVTLENNLSDLNKRLARYEERRRNPSIGMALTGMDEHGRGIWMRLRVRDIGRIENDCVKVNVADHQAFLGVRRLKIPKSKVIFYNAEQVSRIKKQKLKIENEFRNEKGISCKSKKVTKKTSK